ncbi:MAG: type II secretion system protein GspL [Leucothrix sp.]
MQLLIIKLTSPDATPLFAGLTSKKAESNFVPCEWDDVRKHQRGSKVVLLIPNSDVSLAETQIPSKNKKQMLQAIPYALEETLAEDIDDLHFSAYRETDESKVKAAIINRERLGTWVDLLKEHDINVHYILPAVFGLSLAEQGWSIDIGDDEAQIRQGPLDGFASSLDVLDYLLPAALEEHEPEALYVSGDSLRVTRSLQGHEVDIRSGTASSLINIDSIQPALELNLLNNFSRGESALKNVNWTPWKPVAVIGSLLLATWIGMFMWQNKQTSQQLDSLEDQITSVYRTAIPGGKQTDADAQLSSMTSALQQLQGNLTAASVSPLPTIAKLAPLLKQFKKMSIKELGFKRNKLQVKVETPDIGMLEKFKQAAITSKLEVTISSKTTANNVASTLVIQEAI